MSQLIVGVDVGGTFTDLFVLNEAQGKAEIIKVPSTRGEEAKGFMNGVQRIATGEVTPGNGQAANLTTIIHGTTVGTNALLERKIAKTGLITTRGFRDVLEDRKSTRLNSSHVKRSRMPSSA